ncbi:MAG: response regulator [Minicystis sp.]
MDTAARSRSIIVLEDDVDLLEATVDALRIKGYTVEGYTEAHAAIDRLQRPPMACLAIVDYWLGPPMDGDKVVQALRDAGVTVPVVVATAVHPRKINRQLLDSLGVAAVLAKPFGLHRLVQVIEGAADWAQEGQDGLPPELG